MTSSAISVSRASAGTEARPTMRFVELKSQEQLDIQTFHRVRSRLVAERRSLISQSSASLSIARAMSTSRTDSPSASWVVSVTSTRFHTLAHSGW